MAVDDPECVRPAVPPCLFHYSNYLLLVSVKLGSGQAGVR